MSDTKLIDNTACDILVTANYLKELCRVDELSDEADADIFDTIQLLIRLRGFVDNDK